MIHWISNEAFKPPVTSTERSNAMRMPLLVNYYCCSYCLCFIFVFGPCFVVQYLVSFLVLQSSHWGRERDGCFKIAFNVLGLLVLCVSSSRCNGLVCSV